MAAQVTLTEPEVELLRSIVDQMGLVLEAPEETPHTERLFPPAYLDDPAAQDEFARLMTDDLLEGKRRALRRCRHLARRHVRPSRRS